MLQFHFSESSHRSIYGTGVACNVDVVVVATAVAMEGGGWTVKQRCLVAVTLDLVQPDESAVPSKKSVARLVNLHVVTSVE